jgi:hypothetical protein
MLALMSRGWVRSTQTDNENHGYYGYVPQIALFDGQTVLRSCLVGVWTNPGQYPPGGSILRVGMAWATPTDISSTLPTPITNSDADWMDIETIHPRVVLASSVDNIWVLNWDFPKDESVKSQRKNESGDNMYLWVAWEFALYGELSGFTIARWTSSVDAYVNTP